MRNHPQHRTNHYSCAGNAAAGREHHTSIGKPLKTALERQSKYWCQTQPEYYAIYRRTAPQSGCWTCAIATSMVSTTVTAPPSGKPTAKNCSASTDAYRLFNEYALLVHARRWSSRARMIISGRSTATGIWQELSRNWNEVLEKIVWAWQIHSVRQQRNFFNEVAVPQFQNPANPNACSW